MATPTARVDRCVVVDRYVVADRSVETLRAAADRFVEVDHSLGAVQNAAAQNAATPNAVVVQTAEFHVAVIQSVVTPNAVRVVTQKEGDWNVEASRRYEVDRNVVTPHAVLVVTHGVVTPNVVNPRVVRVGSRKERDWSSVASRRYEAYRSYEVYRKSVARIGFQSVAARSLAAGYPRFVAARARVSLRPPAFRAVPCAQDDHQIPAQASPPHLTAPARQQRARSHQVPVHSSSPVYSSSPRVRSSSPRVRSLLVNFAYSAQTCAARVHEKHATGADLHQAPLPAAAPQHPSVHRLSAAPKPYAVH